MEGNIPHRIEMDVGPLVGLESDLMNSVHCPLSSQGRTILLFRVLYHLFLNFFSGTFHMLHTLADYLETAAIEKICINATTVLIDWKLLAQKCSLRAGRQHLVRKSDRDRLLIECHSL